MDFEKVVHVVTFKFDGKGAYLGVGYDKMPITDAFSAAGLDLTSDKYALVKEHSLEKPYIIANKTNYDYFSFEEVAQEYLTVAKTRAKKKAAAKHA